MRPRISAQPDHRNADRANPGMVIGFIGMHSRGLKRRSRSIGTIKLMKKYIIYLRSKRATEVEADSYSYDHQGTPPGALVFLKDGQVVALFASSDVEGFQETT